MKIIAFTFAGGNKYSFRKFTDIINNFIVIEYPGRGLRMSEYLFTELDAIVEDLFLIVQKEITSTQNYVIYGHSMGALVAYLICHKINELKIMSPKKLIFSGKKSPVIIKKNKISKQPDEIFWKEVVKIGGIPDELLGYPELIDFYLPILKADFTAIENYQYEKKEKLTIPIDVFYGSEEASEEEMLGWKEETTEKVTITQLKGNHFFIFNHIDFFTNYFKNLEL